MPVPGRRGTPWEVGEGGVTVVTYPAHLALSKGVYLVLLQRITVLRAAGLAGVGLGPFQVNFKAANRLE